MAELIEGTASVNASLSGSPSVSAGMSKTGYSVSPAQDGSPEMDTVDEIARSKILTELAEFVITEGSDNLTTES